MADLKASSCSSILKSGADCLQGSRDVAQCTSAKQSWYVPSLPVKEDVPVRLPVMDVAMGSSRVVKQEIVLPCDGDLLGICFGGQVSAECLLAGTALIGCIYGFCSVT